MLFISWGSGQNTLYSYLSIPLIALFGLNEFSVRLLSAILGSLSLPLFFLLAYEIRGTAFGLLALLTLAVNPWHIMISRWALESNILPFFLLLGIWLLILSRKSGKHWYLVPASLSFSLSLYAYGTAFLFLPPFLIMSAALLVKRRETKAASFTAALLLFVIISAPITLCNIINVLKTDELCFWGITIPRLTQTRQSATTIFGNGNALENALSNIGSFLKLLWTQSDGLPWNSLPGFGLIYGIPGLIFALTGFFLFLQKLVRKKAPAPELFVFFAFFSALISAFFIDININRVNMAFIPLIYFQALGIYFVMRSAGDIAALFFPAALSLLCVFFTSEYFTGYQQIISRHFYEGLGEAIKYADSSGTETVWVTDEINAPYIYVLFYRQISPYDFQADLRCQNPDGAFISVTGFSKYLFGGTPPDKDTALICADEREGERKFKRFNVILRK